MVGRGQRRVAIRDTGLPVYGSLVDGAHHGRIAAQQYKPVAHPHENLGVCSDAQRVLSWAMTRFCIQFWQRRIAPTVFDTTPLSLAATARRRISHFGSTPSSRCSSVVEAARPFPEVVFYCAFWIYCCRALALWPSPEARRRESNSNALLSASANK